MNQYLRQWIDNTYPLMGNEIEELDHFDLQKFADWMEKKINQKKMTYEEFIDKNYIRKNYKYINKRGEILKSTEVYKIYESYLDNF